MLYIIGGTSRSGKTMLTRRIHQQMNIPYLSTDWLMMGFNDGIPDYGIHHLLWPDQIAEKMWPFLHGMTDNMLFDGMNYLIEGEAILPENAAQLIARYPDHVQTLFLGYTSISVDEKVAFIKKYNRGENDWLTKEPDTYIRDHVKNMIRYSRKIKKKCEQYGLRYMDTSEDFRDSIERSIEYLFP